MGKMSRDCGCGSRCDSHSGVRTRNRRRFGVLVTLQAGVLLAAVSLPSRAPGAVVVAGLPQDPPPQDSAEAALLAAADAIEFAEAVQGPLRLGDEAVPSSAVCLAASPAARVSVAGPARVLAGVGTRPDASQGTRGSVARLARVPKAGATRSDANQAPGVPAAALQECALALEKIFAATNRVDSDPLLDATARRVRALAADGAARIGRLARETASGSKPRRAGEVAARFDLFGDNRTLRLRPLVPLVAGRRYGLVVERRGVAADVVEVVPRGENAPVVASGAFAAPLVEALAGNRHGYAADALHDFVRRLEEQADDGVGHDVFAGVQVRFAEPIEADELSELDARFVPTEALREGEAVQIFRTVDWPRRLRRAVYRARTLPCAPAGLTKIDREDFFGQPEPAVAQLFEGRWLTPSSSVDPAFPTGGAAPAQTAAAPGASLAPVGLRWLVALPEGVNAETPVVLGVDGHAGRAERVLRRHAKGLNARGIALVAIDLPEHGTRGAAGAMFFDPLDPGRLSANLLRSVVDVVAAVHALRVCGLPLSDDAWLRPQRVGYLGYSLGGMVGVMARAVEPDLGPMALAAPGGDLPGWLMLHISSSLGASFVTCLGGREHGDTCQMDGACAPPGVCVVDPFQWEFSRQIALPYSLAAGGVDPLAFVTRRTGEVSHAPLLLVGGGMDYVIYPSLMTHLSDGLRMHPAGAGVRRGPRARRVQWPDLGHDLIDQAPVRQQLYDFLADKLRRPRAVRRLEPE